MELTPLETLEVWSAADSAIMRSSPDAKVQADLDRRLREYEEKRDISVLTLRPGMEPVRWFLRPMHLKAREFVEIPELQRHRQTRAFQVCVEKVEGLTVNGRPWVPKTIEVKWLGEEFSILDDSEVNFLERCQQTAIVMEIGGVALQRGYLSPFSDARYSRPLGSLDPWARKSSADEGTAT